MGAQQTFLEASKTSSRVHRTGVALAVLPSRNLKPRTSSERDMIEHRVHRILEEKSEYVYDQSFDAPDAEAAIMAPMPGSTYWATATGWLPAAQHVRMARSRGAAPVLDAQQEIHLFRRMNYLKYRASRLRESFDRAHVRESDLDELRRLRDEALAVKDQIIRAHLRLVVSIARKRSGRDLNLFELVSDGNLGLIRAVERFDFARGFRFSTYATKAITRRFARSIPSERHRQHRFVTGFEQLLKAAVDHRAEESTCENEPRLNPETVKRLLGELSDRERHILVSRFGLEGAPVLTLAQLGTELGITRQRVLQIESKARERLRALALEEFKKSTRPKGGV
jgi:RNA polymerase primary sigma factor